MYIQSPTKIPEVISCPSVFIAGGISGCPRWQDEIAVMFEGCGYTYFNPRRRDDFAKEGSDAEAQILWEYEAIEKTDIMLFWFPKESICPITLLEYGKSLVWAKDGKIKKLIVGFENGYPRSFDLKIQTKLVNESDPLVIVELYKGFDNFKEAINDLILKGSG